VPEASEFDQWEPEGASASCPVTAVIPTWRTLTTLDMSNNNISQIDDSVVRNTSFLKKCVWSSEAHFSSKYFAFALYLSFSCIYFFFNAG